MGCGPSGICNPKVKMSTTVGQFAAEVMHFSSQYGTDGNVSYVVPNLAGPSTIYPSYGDMTAACVFRTYGPWWELAPSSQPRIGRYAKKTYLGQDFVDLWYAEKVYPTEVRIYETYHPGSVVQIYACDCERDQAGQIVNDCVRWQLLWSGKPQVSISDPRIFSPPLGKVQFATNLIRMVVHHQHLRYYTELDAVELVGTLQDDGTDIDAVYASRMQKLSLKSQDDLGVSPSVAVDNGCFDMLPGELIQLIFANLDLPDLCRVAPTCKLFKKHCYDKLQFTELDLQPHWHMVNENTLGGLSERCQYLQKLSLAWCGDWGSLSTGTFSSFILECGSDLRCLRLSACAFLTAKNIGVVASKCPNLEELDLSSVRVLDSDAFNSLATLSNLTRLNLYRTRITETVIINIIRNSPKLEHLNLGAIQTIQSFDNVVAELVKCKCLLSLNLWRARSLTITGLNAVAEGCKNLLEIDLGWCVQLRGTQFSASFVSFVQSCRKLRKLFLPAVRSISNNDVYAIAAYLPDLEQLDVLGTLSVSADGIQRVLESCPKMCFCDLSFCNSMSDMDIIMLRAAYPRVTIQRSFVSS